MTWAEAFDKLAKPVGAFDSVREAMEWAGLDWSTRVEPVYDADGKKVEGHQLVRHPVKDEVLGVVGKKYKPRSPLAVIDDLGIHRGPSWVAELTAGRVLVAVKDGNGVKDVVYRFHAVPDSEQRPAVNHIGWFTGFNDDDVRVRGRDDAERASNRMAYSLWGKGRL